MPSSYQTELKSWLRQLDILQQENVLLKTKVAEILQKDVDRSTVDSVESYLLAFIEKDAILALLRRDVAYEINSPGNYQRGIAQSAMEEKHENLRRDIIRMEFEFYKLKKDFSNYIAEFIHTP